MTVTKNVLIVDDEKVVVDFLAGLLKVKGYNVLKALDAGSALGYIRSSRIELVLLDMRLLAADGLDILKLLRRDHPGMRVIVMTGYGSDYKRKAEEIGCDAFFEKPILVDELKNKIDGLLTGAGSWPKTEREAETEQGPVSMPQAAVLLFEHRPFVAKMLLSWFSDERRSGGRYTIRLFEPKPPTRSSYPVSRTPDLVLFDAAWTKQFGELSSGLIDFEEPPKEVITFGEPVAEWDKLEAMLNRGIVASEALLGAKAPPPYDSMLTCLSQAVRSACAKYGLCVGGM